MVKWGEIKHLRWGDLKSLTWGDLLLPYEELAKHLDLALPDAENKQLHELCLELEKRFPAKKQAFEIPDLTTVSNLLEITNEALMLGDKLPPTAKLAIQSLFAAMEIIAKSSR